VVEHLQADAGEVAIICRTAARADGMERELNARGAGQIGPRVRVLPWEEADQRSTKAAVLSADVPFDAQSLAALHDRGGTVLVTAREREHLHRIASRAGFALDALPDPGARPGAPERIRERIRAAIRDEDLTAELALIAPLLDELPAAEVAAAAMRLARQSADRSTGGEAGAAQIRAGAPPPTHATTWTHLFIGIGTRDGVGPGDIVGAMTGEAGIAGDQVGKIDLRESHTTVEVATPVAGQVIERLNGRTLKGRSLRVDYDRKAKSSGGGTRSSGSKGTRRPGRGGPRKPRGRG
jgi:ATP-dependent RNA helicase DeaD